MMTPTPERVDLDALIEQAARQVGPSWPLDRAVAVNPLLACLADGFASATTGLGDRLGVSPWPSAEHLEEARRRGLEPPAQGTAAAPAPSRLPTSFERALGLGSAEAERLRVAIAQTLLEAVSGDHGGSLAERAAAVLRSPSSWLDINRRLRERAAVLVTEADLSDLSLMLGSWAPEQLREEFARQLARLPGWSSWARWNDGWAREPHSAGLSTRDVLTVSMALEVASLEDRGALPAGPPEPLARRVDVEGLAQLEALEAVVHGEILAELRPRSATPAEPRLQVVTCIDVRSEPLRRALEAEPTVQTLGFAGFFGIFALVEAAGESEAYESLPVIAPPSARIAGGTPPASLDDGRLAASGTFAELTHEPSAMFALAEGAGWLGAPWLMARSLLPRLHRLRGVDDGPWQLTEGERVDIAEGALRGMGLTAGFAPEVVFLGHASRSTANPHFATLDCGACAGHGGGPNAAALAKLLNDPELRAELARRGIAIPEGTRFLAGEHDTTREQVTLFGEHSSWLLDQVKAATDEVAAWRAQREPKRLRSARRLLERRARDWSETRPEWGLADHAAFVIAPRSSIRSAELGGRAFLHSYDPAADEDGAILNFLMSAPVVVGQWINASYYFSTTAPEVLGAGDKTLLNPVGDFAVIAGDDPDLRIGLPYQSVATGTRPVHLPVRLLVAVEAPLERTAAAVAATPMVTELVEGSWIHLVGRGSPEEPWQRWRPGTGWVAS